MPMGKEIDIEVKKRVVLLRNEGKSLGKIAKQLLMPKSSVQKILENHLKYGTLEDQRPGNCGRKRSTTVRLDNRLVIEVKKNPRVCRNQLRKIAAKMGANICLNTISNRLREKGLRACRPVKAPLLKLVHRQNRKKFAKEHKGRETTKLYLEKFSTIFTYSWSY